MRIYYNCDSCGDFIDAIEVASVDETQLGFDSLTPEERLDLVKYDAVANCLYVQSLCDGCIEALGLSDEGKPLALSNPLN
ncbi:MAG: DUF2757 family protein [Negativicutes bacterium]|nr:DUF2757 family protein [Negativicutes bacterium]